ncbi:hypothetical protein T492DRAFT_1096790 [Pavlovales sp. CCMP2436]|nr:hypothetical protein T492DRAFT_1096790 [Pavlovales sp. CCMP2436]
MYNNSLNVPRKIVLYRGIFTLILVLVLVFIHAVVAVADLLVVVVAIIIFYIYIFCCRYDCYSFLLTWLFIIIDINAGSREYARPSCG